MDRPSVSTRRFRRLPLVVAVGVAITAAAWTAVWATARTRILAEVDGQLAMLAARGVVVACPDRAVGGYPFRMEFSCRDPGVEIRAVGASASAASLRVVAQVWDPRLIQVELDAPGVARDARGVTSATWRGLRASLRWTAQGPQRLSIAAEGLDLTTRPTGAPMVHLTAEHAEAHGRPSGGEGRDLDLAVSFGAASLSLADKRLGPPRSDLAVSATLADFLPPGPGPAAMAFAGRGGLIDPVRLSFSTGGVVVEGAGRLVLDGGGLLDGMITLGARGLESLAKGGAAGLGPELTTVLTGFVLLGKASKDPSLPGRRLEMIVDHGLVRIGRVTLGRIPSLFPPGT